MTQGRGQGRFPRASVAYAATPTPARVLHAGAKNPSLPVLQRELREHVAFAAGEGVGQAADGEGRSGGDQQQRPPMRTASEERKTPTSKSAARMTKSPTPIATK